MKQIYCDNGSTSFPKAPGLGQAIANHIEYNGYNISRGGYEKAYTVEHQVIETKESLCRLFHHHPLREVVFTAGATAGLNMILKGFLKSGDHVITTAMEHNAVVRPLTQLLEQGVMWDTAACDIEGVLDCNALKNLLKENTKLVLVTHGSNVCGSMTNIEEIGHLCKSKGIYFAVDCAQTAGCANIGMEKAKIDALVFSGHKSLLGPQGIGGMILNSKMAEHMTPLLAGGTGSASDSDVMPGFLPDKFQPGTLNIPGIIGLKHALTFIEQEGVEAIKEKELFLTEKFLEGVQNMKEVRLVGKNTLEARCAVVSLDFVTMDNGEVSFLLEENFGIMTRCGLHCAPHAHKTLQTFPQGTVRFSFGYFQSKEDVAYVIDAIHKVTK